MAILGFIFLVLLGGFLLIKGVYILLGAWIVAQFNSGRRNSEHTLFAIIGAIVIAVGATILYWACKLAPFSVFIN